VVPLADRHLEVLLQLVNHPGTILTKNALIDAAWGDVAVTDNSLEQAISALRRLLGDAPLIETVPRRGYRFTGAVTRSVHRETDESLMALLAPHSAWLEGRSILETLDRDRVSTAEAAFQRALTALPDAAPPHIGLANAYVFRFESTRLQESPDVAALERAMMHAREACRLEPTLAESWATLGFVSSRAGAAEALAASRRAVILEPDNWRHQLRLACVGWGEERLRAASRALRLLPGLSLAHFLAATVHVARQSFEAAAQEVSAGITAQDAQPSSGTRFGAVGLHWLNGLLQLRERDETGAQASFQRELVAGNAGHLYAAECCANVHYAMGAAQWARGNSAAAIAEFDRALALASGQPMARAARAALASEGERDALRAQLALRLDRLRAQRLTIDTAMAEGVDAVIRGDIAAAVAAGQQGCLDAPPGSQGWSLPIDPLLRVYTNEAAWTGPLAQLRTRAA
jgi:tetratricopeptide (TPR) repeat protein